MDYQRLKFWHGLLGSAAFLSTAHASQALAMQAAPTENSSANETASGEDIVVTAQRREQKLQDISIAVTAQSGIQLREQNITVSQDIGRVAPSLSVTAFSAVGVVFNIRGISQNDYGDQQEPPVAVYQDDSYASSLVLSGFPIFDLNRVEVLRGPQGTLFGRNATGGAIQFLSNQPTDYLDGYAKLTYASFGTFKAEGAVSGPVSDGLMVRLAGQTSQGGNYFKSVIPNGQDLGGDNNFALRGIVKWVASPDVTASLMLRYLKGRRERNGSLISHIPSCPNAQFQGEFLPADQSCDFFGTPPGAAGTGYRNDAINPLRGGNPYRNAMNYPAYLNRDLFGSQLRVDAALGAVDLTSITDYQHAKKRYSEDSDGSPDDGAEYLASMKFDQVSQEFRASHSTDRNLLVLGAMGIYMNGRYHAFFNLPIYDYFPIVDFSVKTKSYAFFGQDEFKITDQIKVIGGLRYWHDTRKLDYVGSETGSGLYLAYNQGGLVYQLNGVDQPLTGVTISASDANKSFSGVTGRASIEFKPTEDLLIYSSYNRGSKSGGFTISSGTPSPSGVVDTLNSIGYKAEKIDSIEAGLKAKLMPRTTFNIAAYKYWYHDYQAFVQQGIAQSVRNLPAGAYGLEAELATNPLSGLTLRASASLIYSHVNDVTLPDGVTTVTHRLPQVAKFSGTLFGRYEAQLGAGTASIQADAQYKGASCFTVLCAPTDYEKSFTVVNMSVGYDIGNASVRGFVDNLTKKQYRVFSSDLSTLFGTALSMYGRPRTFGASIEYRFR